MGLDLSKTLIIGISSRALFDLEEENEIFENQGVSAYRLYQLENEAKVLKKGTGFPLVEALLRLNKYSADRLVEVIVMSRNSPDTGLRVLNSIEHYNLDITRSVFTGGDSLPSYIEAFGVDFFLSKEESDVQVLINEEICAAALIYNPPEEYEPDNKTVRIAFDADAVVFSDESEQIYKKSGLEEFLRHEKEKAREMLPEGPFARFLKILSYIQSRLDYDRSLLRIAIVTARNSPAHERVIRTLRAWGVHVDEAFFLGGLSKDKILKAFKAHIFFDDQECHLGAASKVVPSSRVPYSSDSPLFKDNSDRPHETGENNLKIWESSLDRHEIGAHEVTAENTDDKLLSFLPGVGNPFIEDDKATLEPIKNGEPPLKVKSSKKMPGKLSKKEDIQTFIDDPDQIGF